MVKFMSSKWRSIVSDPVRHRRALRCIDLISASLLSSNGEYRDASDPYLASGNAGVAVFYAYRFASTKNPADQQSANSILFESLSAALETPVRPSFLFGLTGIGWTASHLSRLICLEFDIEPLLGDIDRLVQATLAKARDQTFQHDLFGGLSGLGAYALERRHTVCGASCVREIVILLEQSAKHSSRGAYWTSPLRKESWTSGNTPPSEYSDLGMARGVPGVVAFLASAAACGFSEATPLLDGAARWLVSQNLPHDSESRLAVGAEPGFVFPDAHTAWCYGDPGVATAILAAARQLEDLEMETMAVDTALAAAVRIPETVKTTDAGFCHGSAGLLHMFNRFHQATGCDLFVDASERWLDARWMRLVSWMGWFQSNSSGHMK